MIIFRLLHIQLREDAADMFLDSPLGDPQLPSDAGIGAALGHQLQHLPLSWAERVQRVISVARSNQLGDERGVDHRPPLAIRCSVSMNSATSVTRLLRR